MIRNTKRHRGLMGASAVAIAASLMLASGAMAQTSTATVRGEVSEPGASITATDVNTGFVTRATAGADGNYALSGLRPGTYRIEVTGPSGATTSQTTTLQVGQQAYIPFELGAESDDVTTVEGITVTLSRLPEVRTSEIATNVTTQQISTLPQNNRNFLNFAALAPGVRLNTDEFRRDFSAGGNTSDGLGSSQVNVFVDGVSLKSNVNQGGVIGQDASRGNPFSQLAVQEFRVATSNFKAEYEQAGTAVITAITRSGGNEFTGEVFGFYQDDSMVEPDFFQRRDGRDTPELSREQYGVALGGPIIQDRLNFFAAWEVNDQVRSNQVTAGGTPEQQALLPFDVADYEGAFSSPFRQDIYFGKLTWRPSDNQTLELSVSHRDEEDLRGFGGTTSVEAGELVNNAVTSVKAQWDYDGANFLNEASVDYRTSSFNPTIVNPDQVGLDYAGVIRIGGRSTAQEVEEQNLTFRNNVTFEPFDWRGSHLFKIGGKVSFNEYSVFSGQNTNPTFIFQNDPAQNLDFSFPAEAFYGVGQPTVTAENVQFGLFIQDDWEINEHLTLNLGVRWDVETNANNQDYVTPDDAVAALRYLEDQLEDQPGNRFFADDYISTGDNRDPFLGAIAPRIGFSYDIFADQRTVIFGGYGRFYDRTLFRNAAEESLFRQFTNRTFRFSEDGADRNGQPTIEWDPSYLSREGLDGLIASGEAPNGELRVVRNDTEPPFTDQFSIGLRQRLGDWQTSISLVHQIGKNEIAYFPANRSTERNAGGFYDNITVPGFGTVVASNNERETRYTALYLTADKPYSAESGWGVSFSYTGADAEQRGYLFNFDFPDVAAQPFYPNAADVAHQIVASGIVDLPWEFQLSTLITLSSGTPFNVIDASNGFGENLVIGNFGRPEREQFLLPDAFAFRQMDLRLSREFEVFGGHRLQLIGEVFNVFDFDNFGCYDGFIPPEGNPNFGNPGCVSGPPRSFQVGMRYRW